MGTRRHPWVVVARRHPWVVGARRHPWVVGTRRPLWWWWVVAVIAGEWAVIVVPLGIMGIDVARLYGSSPCHVGHLVLVSLYQSFD